VAEAYRSRRGEIVEAGRQLLEQMRQGERLRSSATLLTDEILVGAYQAFAQEFDSREGAWAAPPSFPSHELGVPAPLLEAHRQCSRPRHGAPHLDQDGAGGMYDQIGGGFHRYSVDGQWLVPHFEKMLYDNGQLASLYLHAWLATGDAEYRRVCEETLDYILREMTHPSGASSRRRTPTPRASKGSSSCGPRGDRGDPRRS